MALSDDLVSHVAKALEPKCKAFGGGDMPMHVAREFSSAAIRAVFEHLRDNALPHATRVVLNETFQECAEDDAPSAGERIFLAGIEKILEGLPRG